jgi:3,4-dihydroxy 2-butanone 4-phosphate synthase/GTP cyclohydrolase II
MEAGEKSARSLSALSLALESVRTGAMAVVVEGQRSIGGVVMAASEVTPAAISFMIREAGAWMCLALPPDRCHQLRLEPVTREGSGGERALLQPIDAARGIGSGMSLEDRAQTIRTAVASDAGPDDVVTDGHVQVFRTQNWGVLRRRGLAEAGVDLARLAGAPPAAVVCEVQNESGRLADAEELLGFAERHGLAVVTMDALVEHRRLHEQLVENVITAAMPSRYGRFSVTGYRALDSDRVYVALAQGPIADRPETLVNVHVQCRGDVFRSSLCDCRRQLEHALEMIEEQGSGLVIYLTAGNEGKWFGDGPHRLPEDGRDDGVVARILEDLGVERIRLVNDDPRLSQSLSELGLAVSAASFRS